MRFQGQRALVTGAASGIGRATAMRLAAEGATLTIADLNEGGLQETASLIEGDLRVQTYDARDIASCRALVADASADGLDVLCNIGGVLDWGSSLDFDEERFSHVVAVNLTSVFALCRAALPQLIRARGNIVNMSSTAGLTGVAYTTAYAASKHGVIALTKSLAIEFAASGVRVNAVCPGQVDTTMTRQPPPEGALDWSLVMRNAPKLLDGIAAPEDIAAAVAFLASADARKISGVALPVDGAQLAG